MSDSESEPDYNSEEEMPAPSAMNISNSNRTSLKYQKPAIKLAPYSASADSINKSLDNMTTDETNVISEIETQYKGRRAENITWGTTTPIQLQSNFAYSYPINRYEDGELVHFTVSVNDPSILTSCILYDSRGRPTSICQESPRDLARLGRGMTLSEAETTDNNQISIDKHGNPHNVMPFVSRYKHTFSLGFNDPEDYDTVAGTDNDKCFIIEYAPLIPRAYKRIYFNVQNLSFNTRIVNYIIVNRYAYVDDYERVVKTKPAGINTPAKIMP